MRFAVAQVAISFVVGVLPTALIAALLFLWLARLTNRVVAGGWRWPGVWLLTPAFAYANTLYGHQLSVGLLLFGAFYWLSSAQRPFWAALLAIGVLLAYAVVTEYPVAFLTGDAVSLHRVSPEAPGPAPGSGAAASGLAAVIAAGWMTYNTVIFGGPLNLGYSYSELWVTQHHTGFMSLTLPSLAAFWGITFDVASAACLCWRRGCCWRCPVFGSGGARVKRAPNGAWPRRSAWASTCSTPRRGCGGAALPSVRAICCPMLPFLALGSGLSLVRGAGRSGFA